MPLFTVRNDLTQSQYMKEWKYLNRYWVRYAQQGTSVNPVCQGECSWMDMLSSIDSLLGKIRRLLNNHKRHTTETIEKMEEGQRRVSAFRHALVDLIQDMDVSDDESLRSDLSDSSHEQF